MKKSWQKQRIGQKNPGSLKAEITKQKNKFKKDVQQICDDVAAMLISKNKAYGNSALNPVRIFSKASSDEQIRVRIDDKLSRLARGSAAGEDVINDLLGYLVLLKISQKK